MKGFFSLFLGVCLFFNVNFAEAIVVPVDPADLTAQIDKENAVRNNRALAVIRKYKTSINRAASDRGVDAVLVAGSIAAEHALNYDIYDRLQNIKGKQLAQAAALWAQTNIEHPEKNLSLLFDDPNYSNCFGRSDDYNRWLCAAQTWCGNNFSLFRREKQCFKDFTNHFFDPNLHSNAGLSFGVGQFGPVRALMMDDRVGSSQAINFKRHHDVTMVFQKILDPNTVTYYIAATNKYAMGVYASEGYDISQNPGIVATLYNLGNEWYFLNKTKKEDRLPETNDFGKWVNKHIDEIRAAIR